MKELRKYKFHKQPIALASAIVLGVGSILLAAICCIIIRRFGYSFSTKQLGLFGTLMMIVVMALGGQHILCEAIAKNNWRISFVIVTGLIMLSSVYTSYCCAGPFVGDFITEVVYFIYGFLTATVCFGVMFGFMHISVIVAVTVFGCTLYGEGVKDEDEVTEND